MNELTFNDFINKIASYNAEEVEIITKAYKFAENAHKGQKRQSGEEYIIHPLNVAYILATMKADKDTVCAGLLHDVLEDTKTTIKDLKENFNENIANLVDGVTKISKMAFPSENETQCANVRKIVISITNDVRIIIIKLADRLHNMRTLQYKSSIKQKENAIETLEIFAPLAYYIGAYQIRNELEDLSLKYIKPDEYERIDTQRQIIQEESKDCLNEMLYKINSILTSKEIPNEIKIRTKNIYGIYCKIRNGQRINEIHDLLALKVIVDCIDNCYLALMNVHSLYYPINSKFKDYICNPKTNMYRSLHTTVFGPDERLVQTQIRTHEMDNIASYGLTAYWDINKGEARNIMQKDLKEKFQFFKSLKEINRMFSDNQQFVMRAKEELFSSKVYIYTSRGKVLEMPEGSTPIDCAYELGSEIGNHMIEVYVNDEKVSFNHILKNKDRIRIVTDEKILGPNIEWQNQAATTLAKRKIKEFYQKSN